MAVFFIAFLLFYIPFSTTLPLSLYIFLFYFILVGIGRWMLRSRMGEGCGAGGNKLGFQYSGFKPVFHFIGMRNLWILRSRY